jgi:ribonuclease P protein component
LIDGISRRRTFEQLRREGIRVRAGRLALTYVPVDAPRPRVAFAIPRRVGGAVVRNRARRRIRPLLAERVAASGLPVGAYLVQVAAPVDDLDAPALRAEVERLFAALEGRVAA